MLQNRSNFEHKIFNEIRYFFLKTRQHFEKKFVQIKTIQIQIMI